MAYNRASKTLTIKRNTAINTSVAFLLMVAGALITATITFQNLRNQVYVNLQSINDLKASSSELQTDNIDAKVEFSKIQEQLKSIDANILEVKAQLAKQEVIMPIARKVINKVREKPKLPYEPRG